MIPVLIFGLVAQAASTAEGEAQDLIVSMAQYGDDEQANRSAPWWTSIDDTGLKQVLTTALAQNPDLLAADARVQLAQAGTWQSLGGLLPNVAFEAMTQEAPMDGMTLSPFSAAMPDYGEAFASLSELLQGLGPATGTATEDIPDFSGDGADDLPDTFRQSSTMLKGAWEIDVFGRQTLSTIAAGKDAQASAEGRNATMRALSAQIGAAWYDLVAAREQLEIIRQQVDAGQEMLELIELRYERGEGSAIDVLQQRQQLASTEALLPRAQAGLTAAQGRLAIGLGQAPSAELPASSGWPDVGPTPAIGAPARLMVDRADVRAAVRQLESANSKRAAAYASLAPSLTVTGQYGRQYLTVDETEDVENWGIGAVATLPLFGGGRTHAGIKAARANRDIAYMQMRGSVLAAVQQVEAAIAGEQAAIDSLAAVRKQADAAEKAWQESRALYLQGIIPYYTVLAAQTANQAAQLSLIDAQRSRLQSRIQLHAALGGTWLPPKGNEP